MILDMVGSQFLANRAESDQLLWRIFTGQICPRLKQKRVFASQIMILIKFVSNKKKLIFKNCSSELNRLICCLGVARQRRITNSLAFYFRGLSEMIYINHLYGQEVPHIYLLIILYRICMYVVSQLRKISLIKAKIGKKLLIQFQL